MDKAFNHKEHEEKIYKMWEDSGTFKPSKSKKYFSILLPPPNANAPLHYGHAMYTVEDVLIRFHRMRGFSTLWLPGADHAGFETQVVFEKHLEKEGKSRFDFNRDELYKKIWDFVQTNRGTMENQLRRLGFSLDWSNKKFTLDEDVVKTVYKTFKKLSDEGYLYRDSRLVNYCTKHGTAFSDLEVEHVDKESLLYFVEYDVENGKKIVVATTRPETIPGDTAIAVNPKDKRYKDFVGLMAINPLNERQLPIISDSYVKMDFGTGALKVTPSHDENDFELGKKHDLSFVQVIETNGRLNKNAGKYEGLKVNAAREQVVADLVNIGRIKKTEKINNSLGTCYKCGTVLEPLLISQWYVKTKDLAKAAMLKVKDSETKIVPKRFEKVFYHWMENIHDWNISRQIVWGIRIPAWKCGQCGNWSVTDGDEPKSCSCGSSELVQDTDTFDTWFSSGQWTFAALGYPDGDLFKKYYPLSVMETGYDILFFWVARMMMLGIFVTGKSPFKTVYLHGIVRDSKGQKMSKSKGNVINPLEIADKYGSDALRMSLIAGAGAGNDQNYSEEKVRGYRNFANKIWNATRFVKEFEGNEEDETILAKYLTKVKNTEIKVTKKIESFKLNEAAETVYDSFWNDFCDLRIEQAKKGSLSRKSLEEGLKKYLKLLHPFMPFVTEACWQEISQTILASENI